MPDQENSPRSSVEQKKKKLITQLQPVDASDPSDEIIAEVEGRILKATTISDMKIIELQSTVEQRELWSKVLLSLVGLIIVSDMAIVFFTGFGLMKFEDDYTLPLFIASNLAQIFALSLLVVKFLFRSDD